MAERHSTTDHAKHYAGQYAASMLLPAVYFATSSAAPDPYHLFYSDEAVVHKRKLALRRSLQRRRPNDWQWGDTVLSEKVSLSIVSGIFHSLGVGDDLHFRLSPTDLDRSSYEFDLEFQKGNDLIIESQLPVPLHLKDYYLASEEAQKYDREVAIPFMGIDVTFGDDYIVGQKRFHPGIQLATGTPVVVLPLQRYGSNYFSPPFFDYQRTVVTDCIIKEAQYRPFFGLDDTDRLRWADYYVAELLYGIKECRNGLVHCNEDVITRAPGFEIALRKLDFVEGRLQEGQARLRDLPLVA